MNDAASAAQATLPQRVLDGSSLALVVIDGQRRIKLVNGPLQSCLGRADALLESGADFGWR